ncbi:MAG: DUF1634 domain-containing protein [Nitrososphaerota archaeon]
MSQNEKLETIVGTVLIVGVVASLAVTTIAVARYLLSSGPEIVLSDEYRVSAENFFTYVAQLPRDWVAGLMAAGLVTLMLTPYVRVAASLFYFLAIRDLKYVLITALVLAVLTASLLTG